MARARWKKHGSLNPKVVLEKIVSVTNLKDDGTVSYDAFTYFDARLAIVSMVEFPRGIADLDKAKIVNTAIGQASTKGNLNPNGLLNEIDAEIARNMAVRPTNYRLLTSISLGLPSFKKVISIDGVKIRILPGDYPKKYTDRDKLIVSNANVIDDAIIAESPHSYARVIASVNTRTENLAAKKILRALDLFRAICCLFINDHMQPFSNSWSPINKLLLGQVHSLHFSSGAAVNDRIWYEPNFVQVKPYVPKNFKVLRNNFDWALGCLSNCSYSKVLSDALLRFVRALDERNPHTALIRLWGAVEALASPGKAEYEKVTGRCSFLFRERAYHKQILEHIREARNLTVHAGYDSENGRQLCFQLQRYFYQLILFHLRESGTFLSLEEANNLLDHSHELSELKRKKAVVEMAIEYASV